MAAPGNPRPRRKLPNRGQGNRPGRQPLRSVVPGNGQAAGKILNNWQTMNPGDAPVNRGLIRNVLDQGYGKKDVRGLLRSDALGGALTGPSYSSGELVDYFNQNPGEIGQLMGAVKSTRGAPNSYADYLAQGGQPGGYRSRDQLLQEAVLGIGGARDAYLGAARGTGYGTQGAPIQHVPPPQLPPRPAGGDLPPSQPKPGFGLGRIPMPWWQQRGMVSQQRPGMGFENMTPRDKPGTYGGNKKFLANKKRRQNG